MPSQRPYAGLNQSSSEEHGACNYSVVVALGRLDRLGDREAQLTKPEAEGATGDSEELSRPELVAARGLEHQRQELLVDLAVDVLVEILAAVLQALTEEGLDRQPAAPPNGAFPSGRGSPAWADTGAGRDSAVTIGPVTRNSVCLSTLCRLRMFPGQE